MMKAIITGVPLNCCRYATFARELSAGALKRPIPRCDRSSSRISCRAIASKENLSVKKLFVWVIASAMGIGSMGAALAADMPLKAAPPPVPVCTWCGFYIGVDGGGYWAHQSGETNAYPAGFGAPAISGAGFAGIGILPTSHSLNDSGGLGAVHAGYNWQVNNWLFGVEGDWAWLNRSVSNAQTTFDTFNPGPARPDGTMFLSGTNHWIASVRGRLGVIAQPQWMLYVTGGAAWTDSSTTATWIPIPGALSPAPSNSAVSFDSTKTGFVVGAGVEWMFAPHWIARAEYLYYQFDGASATMPFIVPSNGCTPVGTCGWNASTSQLQINTVRAGVSYKF
jgi:outer membrane immunogenic protein